MPKKNMFNHSKAKTPVEYFKNLKEPRKSELKQLDQLIKKTAPKLKPFIQSGMLAYGKYHYKYPSGREGDWFVIGLASQKSYISLYFCALDKKRYVADFYKKDLPKANIGKSCVRFKKLEDVDLKIIKKMIQHAQRVDGMAKV